MSSDLTLRPAVLEDVPILAALYTAARASAVPSMPPALHTADEDRDWLAARLADGRHEVWLAEDADGVVGYALFTETWLDHLFVRPDRTGEGIGEAILEVVKGLRPGGFCLWVFETNLPARRFYERHGLVTLERTDGSANEERAPDVRMAWPGEQPLPFLRSLIDEVDDELAGLLARRTALTAAVQRLKPVGGHQGRDSRREREIVERIAARVPTLGEEQVGRIVHAIITESLDASAVES